MPPAPPARQPARDRRPRRRPFRRAPRGRLERQLAAAEIAFARVNSVDDILRHPHLRRVAVASPWGDIALPPAPARPAGQEEPGYGPLRALGRHTEAVRRELLAGSPRVKRMAACGERIANGEDGGCGPGHVRTCGPRDHMPTVTATAAVPEQPA